VSLSNGSQEFESIRARHIVVRDDAIRGAISEALQPFVGTGGSLDGEPVLAFEKRLGHLSKVRFIVDVEHSNP